MNNINKIAIIGGSGTGKTTLADKLGEKLNLPVYHIDGIQYLEKWKERDEEERDKIILEKVKEPKWVFDGTYRTTLEERVKNADLIIFLDYSNLARLKGVIGRFLKNPGKEKKEILGCKEKINLKFIKFVWNWNKNKRNLVIEILKRNQHKKIMVFKNRRDLNNWYKDMCGML